MNALISTCSCATIVYYRVIIIINVFKVSVYSLSVHKVLLSVSGCIVIKLVCVSCTVYVTKAHCSYYCYENFNFS